MAAALLAGAMGIGPREGTAETVTVPDGEQDGEQADGDIGP
jgi:hypothetical protein